LRRRDGPSRTPASRLTRSLILDNFSHSSHLREERAVTVRRLFIILGIAGTLAAGVLTSSATASTSTSYSGPTSDGGNWVGDVPAPFNGTVLLYSHGFGPLVAADAP